MASFQSTLKSACILLLTTAVASWSPDMSGGLKLVIDGDTYSFSSDICSGGVFFKRLTYVQMTCTHGYFLRRKNGCLMEGSDIIGGLDFVCESVNRDESDLVQAFIPVTNPRSPLDHTVTFFDDSNSLSNLRRYTYVKALEGKYAAPMDTKPVGVIVVNPHQTPKTSIGSFCYEGKAQSTGDAYLMALKDSAAGAEDPANFFRHVCDTNSAEFPFHEAKVFGYYEGYSEASFFKQEVRAVVPPAALLMPEDSSDLTKYEIWGGKAYCLQAEVKETTEGKLQMGGLRPGIKSLESLCPNQSVKPSVTSLVKSLHRRKREDAAAGGAETKKAKYSDLTGCLASCWGPGEASCRRSMHKLGGGPRGRSGAPCPPFCSPQAG